MVVVGARSEEGPSLGIQRATPLGDVAYEAIKALLLDSEGTGKGFSERQLSAALGLGLAPVRMALARLRTEGLIIVTPQAGIRLPEMPPSVIIDFYELRTVLESHVVSELATRGVADDLRKARDCIEVQRAMVDAGDARGYHLEDMRFHLALAEAHGNAEFVRVLSSLSDRMQRLSALLHKGHPERMPRNFSEHEEILSAIADRDAQSARSLLAAHLTGARNHVMDPRSRAGPTGA
jgi:DNA-binding GntR family transcriptional regulator